MTETFSRSKSIIEEVADFSTNQSKSAYQIATDFIRGKWSGSGNRTFYSILSVIRRHRARMAKNTGETTAKVAGTSRTTDTDPAC